MTSTTVSTGGADRLTGVPEGQGRNPWFLFALICIPILIGSIDLTAIVVILPQATLDLLGPQGLARADQALWAVTAYLLAYTISLALVGRLSDVLPRKQVFIACIVIFICGALWAGTATELPLTLLAALPIWPEPEMLPLISLVIGRVIQAIGAGASVSVGMALVGDIFPPERRAEPISLISALDSLGWVVGNLYAGLLLQVLPSWRWLFLINAGVAVIALGFTMVALRGVSTSSRIGHFDWRGAVIFAAALTALTIGVEAINRPGGEGVILMASSAALIVVFVWFQLRTRHALIDMHFVRQREVRKALLTNLIVGFGLILIVAGVPLIINLRAVFLRGEGLLTGALRAGVMLTALTVPLVVAALVGEGRYRRVGVALPVASGLAIAAIGFILTGTWTYTASSYVIAFPLALIGVGLGLTIGPLSLVVIDAAEESARGLASSLVLVMRLLGMTIGTPLAASLTLNLANEWATQRADTLTADLREIARPMLIPPMAIDALARVLLIGAAMCAIGLVAFYLRRAIHTMREAGWRIAFGRTPALIGVVALVTVASVYDAAVTPTVLPNPIARQLPPNVELYVGVNLQQMFLLDSRRPLDAVVDILNTVVSLTESRDADRSSTPPPAPTAGVQIGPPPEPPADTPTDTIVRALFSPRQWSNESYAAFCAAPELIPPSDWQWCFNNGLLSWIGPQAAFALLPRTRAGYDYLFVFQATNRNNAIQFATSMATALSEAPPAARGPNVHMLSINADSADARALAITDAYVMIGTPRAVEYTLSHGNLSLADQPEYQSIAGQLAPGNFATVFFRSNNIEGDLRPALLSLFESPAVDSALRVVGRLSPLLFTRTTTAPTLGGLTMRVTESQLVVNLIASLPFSLQKLNAQPVPQSLLDIVPREASVWLAANVNIAGIAREISIPDTLETIARESGSAELGALLASPLVQGPITAFAQTLQNALTLARGQVLFVALPGEGDTLGPTGLILPLTDRDGLTAAQSVVAIRAQLQLFATLTGALSVEVTTADSGCVGQVVSLGGELLETILPDGLHYTLTADNLLIIAAAELDDVAALCRHDTSGVAREALESSLREPRERFLYAHVMPPQQAENAVLLLGGDIQRQMLFLDLVLDTRP
jgi:MFS family permease